MLPRDTKEDIYLSTSSNFQCLHEASFQRTGFGSLLTKGLACAMTNDERFKQRSFLKSNLNMFRTCSENDKNPAMYTSRLNACGPIIER